MTKLHWPKAILSQMMTCLAIPPKIHSKIMMLKLQLTPFQVYGDSNLVILSYGLLHQKAEYVQAY